MMSISQRADLAEKALLGDLQSLKESIDKNKASIKTTNEKMQSLLLDIEPLESRLDASGQLFLLMQKLHDFVTAICDLLKHKLSEMCKLEKQMWEVRAKRARAQSNRRDAKAYEMKKLEMAVEAAISNLGNGCRDQMIEVAKSIARAASRAATELRDPPVQLNGYDRDEIFETRMHSGKRSETWQHQKNESDSQGLIEMEGDPLYQLTEGDASPDESDSEITAYESDHRKVVENSELVFADVAEEYADISAFFELLQEWKEKHLSCYNNSDLLPTAGFVFGPYIRLEFMKWDPLQKETDFKDMKWHSVLEKAGLCLLENAGENSTGDPNKVGSRDANANLIAKQVEIIALTLLQRNLVDLWDVLSTRQTEHAVFATNLVLAYVPQSSAAVKELLTIIPDRLSVAVAKLTIPSWDTFILELVPNAAQVVGYRFGASVRLMRNICLWKNIIGRTVLEKIVLTDLLGGKVLPHLRSIQSSLSDAISRSERIVSSLDEVWADPSANGSRSPQLQPFVDYILALAQTLQDKNVVETETTEFARRLMKMLLDLREYDHARRICSIFNLEWEK